MIHFGYTVLIRRSVHMSVYSMYTRKGKIFPPPFAYLCSKVTPPSHYFCYLFIYLLGSKDWDCKEEVRRVRCKNMNI